MLTLRITVITNLAEGEADAAPALEDVVSRGTLLHTGIPMLEVPAGHTATCITWLRTATQALVMAALALEATRTMLTVVQAHWRKGRRRGEKGKRWLISGLIHVDSVVFYFGPH